MQSETKRYHLKYHETNQGLRNISHKNASHFYTHNSKIILEEIQDGLNRQKTTLENFKVYQDVNYFPINAILIKISVVVCVCTNESCVTGC